MPNCLAAESTCTRTRLPNLVSETLSCVEDLVYYSGSVLSFTGQTGIKLLFGATRRESTELSFCPYFI